MDDAAQIRSYRLDIKRRVYSQNQNTTTDDGDIVALDANERKEKLTEAFDMIHQENLRLLSKIA